MGKNVLNYQSITVPVPAGEQVHMTRFYRDKKNLGTPVFMLHGLLEDGTAFYDGSGKGLACYLAHQGFDVFVADSRGKGSSWPKINAKSHVGVHEHITEDIPALIKKVSLIRPDQPQVWVSHGWGGVLLSAYYARFVEPGLEPTQLIHLASRRKAYLSNWLKRFVHRWLWRRIGGLCVAFNGYLPSRFLCLGDCLESTDDYRDYLNWTQSSEWVDPKDGFDYGSAIRLKTLPPSLYVASVGDHVYGDVIDVRAFIKELGRHDGRMIVLDKKAGSLHNYNHNELLSHADAEQDHFSLLLAWLQEYQSAVELSEGQTFNA